MFPSGTALLFDYPVFRLVRSAFPMDRRAGLASLFFITLLYNQLNSGMLKTV
jgi:hypothetical protein